VAEVHSDAGGSVEVDGDYGQGERHLELPSFVEHELHHDSSDVDAVVHHLLNVVEE